MNKKNIAYLLLAAAAFVLLTRRQSAAPAQPSPTLLPVPPRPATTGQALTNWVITVMRLVGTAKELWEPGGPFYGRDRNKDLQMLPNNLPPNTNNTGYV